MPIYIALNCRGATREFHPMLENGFEIMEYSASSRASMSRLAALVLFPPPINKNDVCVLNYIQNYPVIALNIESYLSG